MSVSVTLSASRRVTNPMCTEPAICPTATKGVPTPGADRRGRPKQDYANRLADLEEASFYKECRTRIWLSAFSTCDRLSDHHWQVQACKSESMRRARPDIFDDALAAFRPKV